MEDRTIARHLLGRQLQPRLHKSIRQGCQVVQTTDPAATLNGVGRQRIVAFPRREYGHRGQVGSSGVTRNIDPIRIAVEVRCMRVCPGDRGAALAHDLIDVHSGHKA